MTIQVADRGLDLHRVTTEWCGVDLLYTGCLDPEGFAFSIQRERRTTCLPLLVPSSKTGVSHDATSGTLQHKLPGLDVDIKCLSSDSQVRARPQKPEANRL